MSDCVVASARSRPPARLVWLGRRAYRPALELQAALAEARAAGAVGDTVLLLEHEPVITLGRNARQEHVVASTVELGGARVDLVHTNRGGDVTYHGPGQLVGYPIVDLKPDRCDVRRYVSALAEIMIALLEPWSVAAGVAPGLVGVWTDAAAPDQWSGPESAGRLAKIGAIGVRLSNWISMHGFALNLAVELDAYRWIVPCGIREHPVTSVAALTGARPRVDEVALGAGRLLDQQLRLGTEQVEDLSELSTEQLSRRLVASR